MKITDEYIDNMLSEHGILLFPCDLTQREKRIAYEAFRLGMKEKDKGDNVGEGYLVDELLPCIEIRDRTLDYDSLRSWLEVTPNIFGRDDLHNNPVARFFGFGVMATNTDITVPEEGVFVDVALPQWLQTFLEYCDNRDTKHDFYTNKMALEYLDAAVKKHAGL